MVHICYACDPANPDRAVVDAGRRLRVPARFTGPPGGANGGMAAGLLACPALSASGVPHAAITRIRARLHRSVPVERDLAIDAALAEGGVAVAVRDGHEVLVSGNVSLSALASLALAGAALAGIPPERAADVAEMARVETPDRPPFWEETGEHPIRGCFSCGPDHPDGLRIFPRIVSDGVICSDWAPAGAFDDGGGVLAQSVVASALDCSSGICMPVRYQRELLDEDRFFLLGSLDIRYLRVAAAGARYRVVAKALLRDGRKFYGMSALFDDAGVAYAMVEATWIVAGITRTQAFGP